jgi:branched-chain amino acid transport system substrate-binding protein
MMHTRRRFAAVALGSVAALALAACGAGSGGSSDGNVVLGVINTFGDPAQGASASDQYEGMQLGVKYVAEHGGLYNGAKLELRQGNENGQTALVSTSVRKMVNDGVKLIIGPALTADCLAAAPIVDQAGGVSQVGCTTTSVTGKGRSGKNLFRWDTNDAITSTALATEAARKFPDTQVVDVVAYDYLQGHQGVETIEKTLHAQGINFATGKVFYVPSGTTNYSSQVGALAQQPKDGKKRVLVLLTWGSGYLNFIQQALPLNILANYEAVITTSMYYTSAKALNGKAPAVYNSYGTCHASLWKNPVMDWFTQQMQATYHRLPDDWSSSGFNQVLVYAAAINKAKSIDPKKVLEAESTLTVETANGTMTMNPETHQAQRSTPVCETQGDPGSPEGVKMVTGEVLPPEATNAAGAGA